MVIDWHWNSISDVGHESSGADSSEFRGTKRERVQHPQLDVGTSAASYSNDSCVDAPLQRSNKSALHQHMARWEDDSSSDEGTSTCNRRYKRAKHTGAYNGWLETSTLKAVAQRFRGTASQFRIVRVVSHFKNSMTHSSIHSGSLIVKSRFVSPTGNVSGQTSVFLNWKLPGKIKSHHSLYKDARPWFHDAGTPLNAYPSVTLGSDLHPAVKTIISTFLREAEPGMTPIEFFGKGDDPELFALFRDHCYVPPGEIDQRDRLHAAARNEAGQSGARGDDTTSISDTFTQGAKELHHLGKSTHDADNDEGAGPFDNDISYPAVLGAHALAGKKDGPNSLCEGENNKKRSWDQFISCQHSARSKSKCSGGPKPHSLTEASFYVDSSPSKQFLVLIEGFVEYAGSTETASSDHLRDCLPSKGRLVDLLPNAAQSGLWLADILGANCIQKRVSGLSRGLMRDSNGARIALRHNSMRDLGILSDNEVMTPKPGSTTRQVHVSRIDPAVNRGKNFYLQGVVHNDVDPLVIGSLSIVAYEGRSSWTEANIERVGELASGVLLACKEKASELSVNGLCRKADVNSLMPMHDTKGVEAGQLVSTNLGVSYLCNMKSTDNYIVLVGHDDEGRTVAVDVVLNPKALRCSQPADKTCSTVSGPKQSVSNVERFTNGAYVINQQGLQDGDSVADGSSARFPTMAAFSFPNLGLTEEKCGQVFPTESTGKIGGTGRPSTVTPAPSMRKKKELAVEIQSPLPPKEATPATLPLVTPCADRVPETSKHKLRPQSIDQLCNEHSNIAVADGDVVAGNRSEPVQNINDNTTSCKRYDSIVNRDPGNPIRSKLHWNRPGYFIFFVCLLVFCMRIPEHLPESPRGRSVEAEKQGSFNEILDKEDAFQSPIGYSIVGSEIVSVGAAVLVAVIFGSA